MRIKADKNKTRREKVFSNIYIFPQTKEITKALAAETFILSSRCPLKTGCCDFMGGIV